MKNFTPVTRKSFSLILKKIILPCCLVTGLTTAGWSQASLNSLFPAGIKICVATNASFSVAATATGTITYQWQESTDGGSTWKNLAENTTTGTNPLYGIYTGTTSAVLTITRAPSTMNGNKYRSIVYVNGINPVISIVAILNVGPDVSLDDAISMNCPTTSNTLSTAGAAGVSYQWQVSSNAGVSWTNIVNGADPSGVTYSAGASGLLVISLLTTAIDGYQYRYIANDGQGCVITSGVTTQQVPALAVTSLPAAGVITANVGASVSIPATVTAGTGPFTYQWQLAVGAGTFGPISTTNTSYTGVTTSTLGVPSVTTAMYSNRYRVVVKNVGSCAAASSTFVQIGLPVTLPVTISSFTGEKQGSSAVKLSWAVDASFIVQSYTVQRSADGTSFTDVGSVKGENGKNSYTLIDGTPGHGIVQYRLKMTGQDNLDTYSAVIKITTDEVSNRIELRPSFSTEGFTSLYTALEKHENIIVTVTDVTGRLLWSESVIVEKGENYTSLNVSRLSKGIYYVHVASVDGISKTLPFVKN
jgi:hypothetical protein